MKKTIFWTLFGVFLLLIILTIALCSVYLVKYNKVSASAGDIKTVVIDAGHGGPDGGAVADDGTCEKNINLNIAYCLKSLCVASGYKAVLTRKTDELICDDKTASLREQNVSDLHNRLDIAESYSNNIFVSIHLNKFEDGRYWGAQTFYSPNNGDSKVLSDLILENITNSIQPDNIRKSKEMDSSVYIIYNATMPAVLVECGFLSNADELKLLKSDKYQQKLAFCIWCGINDYYLKQRG